MQHKMLAQMALAQCRAGRPLVELTQPALAESACLGLSTVVDSEKSRRTVALSSFAFMKAALKAPSVDFIPENVGGAGVRLLKSGQE